MSVTLKKVIDHCAAEITVLDGFAGDLGAEAQKNKVAESILLTQRSALQALANGLINVKQALDKVEAKPAKK